VNLQPVIDWLENGCDPKEAAKELRICQAKIDKAMKERKPGWYWVRKAGWGGEYGDWTPALWKPEFRSWASVGFSGIPDSEMIVGARLEPQALTQNKY
jgi:hypothetical protein